MHIYIYKYIYIYICLHADTYSTLMYARCFCIRDACMKENSMHQRFHGRSGSRMGLDQNQHPRIQPAIPITTATTVNTRRAQHLPLPKPGQRKFSTPPAGGDTAPWRWGSAWGWQQLSSRVHLSPVYGGFWCTFWSNSAWLYNHRGRSPPQSSRDSTAVLLKYKTRSEALPKSACM